MPRRLTLFLILMSFVLPMTVSAQDAGNTATDRQRAMELHNQGVALYQVGRYAEALEVFEEALIIVRNIGERWGEGVILGNIGLVYHAQGQYAEALDFYTQALAIAREVGNRAVEGTTLNNIGAVYRGQGQYAEALAFLTQALDIRHEVGDRAGEGTTLNNIGGVYEAQGQYAEALDFYTQALAIHQEVGNRAGEGDTLNDIGLVYHDQGQYGDALDFYTQALDIHREVGNRAGEGTTLSNIGNVYLAQGQYGDALDFYIQVLAIHQEVGNRAVEGTTLSNIGLVYYAQGQYADALNFLTQALAIHQEVGNRAVEGTTLGNIGLVYADQGQYGEALDFYSQALDIGREVGNKSGETFTLGNRALLYENFGQNSDAITDYQATIEVSEQVVASGALDTSISSLAQQPQNVRPYQRLSVLLAVEGNVPQALDYAERGRAILTRTELSSAAIDFRANVDQSLLDRELDLRLELQSSQNLLDSLRQGTSAIREDMDAAQEALDNTRGAYDRHLETMQLQGGYLSREISFQTATLEQIQSVVPQDTTLLVYSIGDAGLANTDLPKSVVFLVTRDSLDAVILDVIDEEIDERVRAFSVDRHTGDVALGDLYDMVFAPIADRISTSHLIIAPGGSLNYVPFAALFTETDGQRHYLIDDYTIRMTPSATALWLLSERQSATASNPGLVMSQDHAPGLPNLPNAFIEALQVGEILGVDAIRDGTETQLRERVAGNGVLHISAHAELNRFAPLYSVIHLGADGEHDGRLEVREIYELDLSQGTELVVLSGCETGSGGDGEDFGLLNRAFFAAGAQEVVSSLWTVDDRATADLLVTFMEQRALYDDDAEALRAAMLIIRDEHPEPYLWASFVITGMGS